MALPTLEMAKKLVASSHAAKKRILAIARRLEALNEYHPEQALIVATDIVLHSLAKGLNSSGRPSAGAATDVQTL